MKPGFHADQAALLQDLRVVIAYCRQVVQRDVFFLPK